MNDSDTGGYTVSYGRDETQFPVYVIAAVAVIFIGSAMFTGLTILFIIGLLAAGVVYYNFPLLETWRARLGANQYGIFIEGFGVIRWGAVERIDLVPIAVRILTINELQIALKVPLGQALVVDWRRLPMHRLLMRLPWTMTHNNVIRINLEPLDRPPDEIHRSLERMWKFYRS